MYRVVLFALGKNEEKEVGMSCFYARDVRGVNDF